jgi:hypothetical protein
MCCFCCKTGFFTLKNQVNNYDNYIISLATHWLNSYTPPTAAKGLSPPSQDLSRHAAIQQLWGRGLLEAADLGATTTQNIEDLLLCPCSLFFVTNRYSPFPSWQAAGTFECHGYPCTSGKCDNNNNCAMTPNDDNQLNNDGGEDVAHARGEATVHQDSAAGASRGGGGVVGGDSTTSRANQRVEQRDATQQPGSASSGCRDKKPHNNEPGKWVSNAK